MLIVEAARQLARWRYVEVRLFEIAGAWVATTPEDDVARWLATTAHHHAWRASLWSAREPLLHDAPSPGDPDDWRVLLDAVADPADTPSRLAGLRMALDALVEEYERAQADLDEVGDAPVQRALHLALPDARDDREGAAAVTAVDAADHRAALSSLRSALRS